MAEDDLESKVTELHEHLVATRERPIEREASRWIGEADAIASDLVGADLEPAVITTRVERVKELLSNVDGTEDPIADERVEQARTVAAAISATANE